MRPLYSLGTTDTAVAKRKLAKLVAALDSGVDLSEAALDARQAERASDYAQGCGVRHQPARPIMTPRRRCVAMSAALVSRASSSFERALLRARSMAFAACRSDSRAPRFCAGSSACAIDPDGERTATAPSAKSSFRPGRARRTAPCRSHSTCGAAPIGRRNVEDDCVTARIARDDSRVVSDWEEPRGQRRRVGSAFAGRPCC